MKNDYRRARKKVRNLLINEGYITPDYPFRFMKRSSMREIGQTTCDTALCFTAFKFGTGMNPVETARAISEFLSRQLPSNEVKKRVNSVYAVFTFLQ